MPLLSPTWCTVARYYVVVQVACPQYILNTWLDKPSIQRLETSHIRLTPSGAESGITILLRLNTRAVNYASKPWENKIRVELFHLTDKTPPDDVTKHSDSLLAYKGPFPRFDVCGIARHTRTLLDLVVGLGTYLSRYYPTHV